MISAEQIDLISKLEKDTKRQILVDSLITVISLGGFIIFSIFALDFIVNKVISWL